MKDRFVYQERVRIRFALNSKDERIPMFGAVGHVYRPRRGDNGAWIRLDTRSTIPGAHPFPEDDDRGRDILTYPDWCEVE